VLNSKVIICADDFGQNEPISQGIYELVVIQRLNAVSCMVTGDVWDIYKSKILPFTNDIQIGLHLNLTHGNGLSQVSFPSLSKLIIQTYRLWPVSKTWLKSEITAQIIKFKQDIGCWPQFIDGHQHVHQLPIIREILLEVVDELEFQPWFRTTYHTLNSALKYKSSWKKWILFMLGGNYFYQLLQAKGYKTNKNFSGDYQFNAKINYRDQFLKSLQSIEGEGLIMCHPGLKSHDLSDPIRHVRVKEFNYMRSIQFLEDIK